MNIIRDIVLSAADIPPGHTERGLCPFCAGGKTREISFAITRVDDGSVLYLCHRAKCGASGRIGGLRTQKFKTNPKRKSRVNPYAGKLSRLPDDVREHMMEQFDCVPHGSMWAPDFDEGAGRVAMPIWGPTGKRRGWSMRSYAGATPKTLIYMNYDEPCMSWQLPEDPGNTAWIVEDQVSAAKLCNTVAASSVAMLGVGLHEDRKVRELTRFVDVLVIALDPDATDVAVAAKRNLRLWFDEVRVAFLDKDIKDMTTEEIKCLYSRCSQ